MYIFIFCLLVDLGIYVFGEPPFLVTTIVKWLFGSTGMIVLSAGIWWAFTLLGIGVMLRFKSKVGVLIVAAISLSLWGFNYLSPLGSMTLALEFPKLVWGILELFYVLILVSVELLIFKR